MGQALLAARGLRRPVLGEWDAAVIQSISHTCTSDSLRLSKADFAKVRCSAQSCDQIS